MSSDSSGGAPIVRGRKRSFTVVWDDDFVDGMSARAWGVYCYLVGRPAGWECRVYDLSKRFSEGRDALYTAIGELVDLGLLVKEHYLEGGLRRCRYRLDDPDDAGTETSRSAPGTDSQEPGNPGPGNPHPGNPDPENPPRVSTEVVTTDQANTDPEAPPPAGGGRANGDVLDGMPTPPAGARGGDATRQQAKDRLNVLAEQITRQRFDAVNPTPPGYRGAKQLVRSMLGGGYDAAWLSAALQLVLSQGRPVSTGTMQRALEEAYDLPTCPAAVRDAARPIVDGWRAARGASGTRRPSTPGNHLGVVRDGDDVHDERRRAFG